MAASMSRYTVELVTQVPKVDGREMKESFELRVWDNDRGGESREISTSRVVNASSSKRPFVAAWRST